MKWETSSGLTEEKVECHCRELGWKAFLESMRDRWGACAGTTTGVCGRDRLRTRLAALRGVDIGNWAGTIKKESQMEAVVEQT